MYKLFSLLYIYKLYSLLYIYLMRVLWPWHSQRSGEIDAVEGRALAIRKVGGGGKGRQLAISAINRHNV